MDPRLNRWKDPVYALVVFLVLDAVMMIGNMRRAALACGCLMRCTLCHGPDRKTPVNKRENILGLHIC